MAHDVIVMCAKMILREFYIRTTAIEGNCLSTYLIRCFLFLKKVIKVDEVKWKNTKDYLDLRREIRLEVIKEIQETAGCKKCKKFMKITEKDLREKPR